MKKVFYLFISSLILSSCGNSSDDAGKTDKPANKVDSSSLAVGVSGKVFHIPSPIQTAILIQKSGAPYNKELLNWANQDHS